MMGKLTASQTFVVVAMGLVAGAGAVALHLHGGLPAPMAVTAALAAYLLLLSGHAFAWRGQGASFGLLSPRDRREQELQRAKSDVRQPSPATQQQRARPAAPAPAPQQQRTAAQPQSPMGSSFNGMRERDSLDQLGEFVQRTSQKAAMPPPMPRAPERAAPPPLPAAVAALAVPAGAPPAREPSGPPPQDDLQDLWSFRPAQAELDLPPFVSGHVTRQAQPAAAPAPAVPPPAPRRAPREQDVEVIQDAIKRLLEEVNAAERHENAAAAAQPARNVPPMPQAQAQAPAPEAAIDRSVDALRMTADSMRTAFGQRETPMQAEPQAPRAAPGGPPPLPPFVRGVASARAASPADARARLMSDAISAGRIDVLLEPILGLEDRQTRHYEVTVRLRDSDGRPLEVTPGGPDLRGTGLLPLFDGVRITRTAAVARRLEERGKGGSVFSAFSGESVADEHFLGELAETLHQRASLASQLVLSFTQQDVRGFSTPEWDSLADMRALGFRFALSAITDLDMDCEALAEQGFAFVKLDASVFLDGLRAPSGHIPSSDVCRHLARHGLTLVVERIEDEQQLARVFGFGVLLGQGQFFGGARPVRADVVQPRGSSNAAA
jgi:cyclic-di-GMP phosphodiesterase TipF (flagellum assembly factor)